MQNTIGQLLRHCESPELPDGIVGRVMQRIQKEDRRHLWRRVILFALMSIGSAIAMIPATQFVLADLVQSGFSDFFSLLFTDGGMVLTYWQDFTTVLVESIPAVSIAFFLALLFTFLESLRFLVRDVARMYAHQ